MPEPIFVIEVHQEHNLTGLTRDQVQGYFDDLDQRIIKLDPTWIDHLATYGNKDRYWVKTVTDQARCPWGYSWFREGQDGRLELWRADWDSSG